MCLSGRKEFLLVIQCLTYNQSEFIADALHGFAIQQTNFPFLTLVFEDASTDGEQEVIKSYMNEHLDHSEETGYKQWETEDACYTFARHQENENCFFMVALLKKNLYRNPRKGELMKAWYDNAKYIALCEGDDYWIDPLKLQKQVDFLEGHEEYAMCFTNCLVNQAGSVSYGNAFIWDTYTTEDMLLHNSLDMIKRGDHVVSPGHTSTILYRNPKEPRPDWISKCFIGDEPLFIALSKYGKAKFINDATSVYREGVGVSSTDFSFERDKCNRVQMYKLIDKGFDYKYHRLISSKIISRYYKKLTRIALNEKHYFKSIGYFLRSLWAKIV